MFHNRMFPKLAVRCLRIQLNYSHSRIGTKLARPPARCYTDFHGRTTTSKIALAEVATAEKAQRSLVYYVLSIMCFFWGLAFWSVPFWRIFCEADQSSWQSAFTGNRGHDTSKVKLMEPDYDRPMVVRFSAR